MVESNQKKISKFLNSDKLTYKGLEKENLRSDLDGKISNKSFPKSFGVHNFNRYITLDYSEPHLELVTPPFVKNFDAYNFLCDLHKYVEENLDGDLLWNYSMPPKFKSKYIKLPPHRESNTTKLAHLYRLGLRNRYGDKMQSTAGIHFNFSFSDSVIRALGNNKTEIYLGVSRNFLRLFPIILRLIGCSPVTHKSFLKGRQINIENLDEDDCYLPKSTSLRVSRLGYYSEEQDESLITFNSLEEYLLTLKNYINNPNDKFKNISLDLKQQVNNGTIQMESELYNHVRPKGIISKDIRAYTQLKNKGIEYLEIRSIDLNPYTKIGISLEDIEFLELVLIFCALSDSPLISDLESDCIKENIRRSSEAGQDCNFIGGLESENAEESAESATKEFLQKLENFAFDIGLEKDSEKMFSEYTKRNNKPLSKKLIYDLEKYENLLAFIVKKSAPINHEINKDNRALFEKERDLSEKQYVHEKKEDNMLFEEYLEHFRGEIK